MFEILTGVGISLLNIAIHGLLTVLMVHAVHFQTKIRTLFNATVHMIVIMVVAAAILMTAHLIEVWVWSAFYHLLDVTPGIEDDFTFAFINYTTLGYGHIVPSEPWMVIGPMTAMNGVLLFGWSTAVLFQVLFIVSRQFGFKY